MFFMVQFLFTLRLDKSGKGARGVGFPLEHFPVHPEACLRGLPPGDTGSLDVGAHAAGGQARTWFSGSTQAFSVPLEWRIQLGTPGQSRLFHSPQSQHFQTSTPCL